MKTLSISIDLDPVYCYYQIHGIESVLKYDVDPVYSKAIFRIYKFFEELNIKPTLFVVGNQFENDNVVENFKNAVANQYELANHTYNHLYNFSLIDEQSIQSEITGCNDIILSKLGYKMCGFRAPGYNVNRRVFEYLIAHGFRYDSSILPSPFYYFAKCFIIFVYKVFCRESRSICGSIKMPFAMRTPYFTDEKTIYSPSDSKIMEIPISTAGMFGFPYVGTFIMGYREWMYKYLLKRCGYFSFLNIELHGIDFLDSKDIGDDKRLIKSQFDLNVPIEKKLGRLRNIIEKFNPDKILRLSDISI